METIGKEELKPGGSLLQSQSVDETFRLVFEAAPSATIMVNAQGLITLVNTKTERQFGYQREKLLAHPIEMLVSASYRTAHPNYRKAFFGPPDPRAMGAGHDLRGFRKDGRKVPIEIGLNPIHTTEGAFVLVNIVDITERKRAEQRFRQMNYDTQERRKNSGS